MTGALNQIDGDPGAIASYGDIPPAVVEATTGLAPAMAESATFAQAQTVAEQAVRDFATELNTRVGGICQAARTSGQAYLTGNEQAEAEIRGI